MKLWAVFSFSLRTIRNTNSNVILRIINIDDEVKLAKNFDNNTLTRRNSFDSFFEESNFKVLNILGNNMFVMQNLDDLNDVQTGFKGRLRKEINFNSFLFYNLLFFYASRAKFPPKTTKKLSPPWNSSVWLLHHS